MDNKKISSALISVYDKTGLEEVVNLLNKNGVLIYSTGGTYDFIKKLGIPVVSVESLTDFPEILGGRVKTLHPKVFGGILNQRDSKSDQKEVKKYSIPQIDLVIVDLYPFEETVADQDATHAEVIEKIDIGGISLIRAAAKNYNDVLVVSNKNQYLALLQVLDKDCSTELEVREEFAIDAFNNTSNYDNEIFKYMIGDDIQLPGMEKSSERSSLNLNITKDDYNLNDFIYCWDKFGGRPNRIVIHNTYSTKLFNKVMESIILDKNVFTEVIPDSEEVIINDKILAKLDENCYLSYVIADRNMDNSFIDSITFYYDGGYERITDILEELNDCILDYCEDDSNKLNTIGLSVNGLEIEPINMKEENDNIDLFYNSATFKGITKSIKGIKKADKGLTIFYGPRGTGKTSIINHVASKLDRIVIFIPSSMIEHTINNPEFRKFIKKYEKPILVVDDCEMFFGDIYSKSSIFSNNVLQMVDGFLSDTMNANLILIMNIDDEDEIDPSLLECNNLIEVVEFTNLTVEESNDLAKSLGSNKKYKIESSVVDIVNKRTSDEEITIGF
jgi:hypothetical protein